MHRPINSCIAVAIACTCSGCSVESLLVFSEVARHYCANHEAAASARAILHMTSRCSLNKHSNGGGDGGGVASLRRRTSVTTKSSAFNA
eukprot:m.51186 g.51186  ORF g.51186 m.51186 type:complete len:89 (-) comp9039_c0_seq1:782-1048(-)